MGKSQQRSNTSQNMMDKTFSQNMMAKAFSILFLPLALSSFLASDLRSTESMISEAGYKAESHKVVTPDQYILTMYRIVGNGPVVFMQHGMVGSSTAWLLAGANHGAPAFRLAEQGYDVWLGNFRGNHESRDHMTLDPDTDDEFWQFSQDEMSKYDLPSQLNYVLQSTKKEKIFYVGHSMGTTTYMAMNSMDQSWSEKVELAIFLAPVAYVGHMRSPVKVKLFRFRFLPKNTFNFSSWLHFRTKFSLWWITWGLVASD